MSSEDVVETDVDQGIVSKVLMLEGQVEIELLADRQFLRQSTAKGPMEWSNRLEKSCSGFINPYLQRHRTLHHQPLRRLRPMMPVIVESVGPKFVAESIRKDLTIHRA
jgi:hypothetical protein